MIEARDRYRNLLLATGQEGVRNKVKRLDTGG